MITCLGDKNITKEKKIVYGRLFLENPHFVLCWMYTLLLKSTRLLNFGNLSSLPVFSFIITYRNSRKCLHYPFIRHISTLPVYLSYKNIPLYPLNRVYPFIRHLKVLLLSFDLYVHIVHCNGETTL